MPKTTLKRGEFYPVCDSIPYEQRKALGLDSNAFPMTSIGLGVRGVHGVWTGEFRAPKKGEWYFSGAYIETYLAKNDLSTPYHIARLVRTKTVTKTEIIPVEVVTAVNIFEDK